MHWILISNEKEGATDTYSNINVSQMQWLKERNDSKAYDLYDFTDLTFWKRQNCRNMCQCIGGFWKLKINDILTLRHSPAGLFEGLELYVLIFWLWWLLYDTVYFKTYRTPCHKRWILMYTNKIIIKKGVTAFTQHTQKCWLALKEEIYVI